MKKLGKILALLMFLFSACKKDEQNLPHTIVEGYVIHSGTKQPLGSVRISIWDGVGKIKQNNYDTTYTNAQGFFHIEVDGNEPVMFLYKKNYSFEYHLEGAALGIVPLTVGFHRDMKFEMDAFAYINPWFQGRNSISTDTALFDLLNSKGIKEGWLSTYLGNGPHHFGISFNGYLTKGDTYKAYWLRYQIKGKWFERVDSVYVPSFKTWSDTIYY